ncbi:HtaA domain-containing protein [Microbacterium halotolerans]|uniref:HtaA domain-containing protein n=1 Tax=Microbacterium halotolerans TaxID=246613 RepID=UPI0013C35BC7|nr:HtaA domain-containing protein [Microbacterium halotolerans]
MDRSCIVEWGVKRSLLEYMQRAGDLEVEVEGGAGFDADAGVTIPAVREPDGRVRFLGSVVLRAHQGALEVPIVDGEIADDVLSIADPAGEDGDRLALVALVAVPGNGEGAQRWTSRLAEDADALFRYNYVPRAAFEDVVVREA